MSPASAPSRFRAALALSAVLAGEVLAAWALHGVASVPGLAGPPAHPAGWRAWAVATPPPDALAAIMRLFALGLVWWLLASTLLSILACVAGWRPARTAAAVLSLPAVRRLADRALAGALAASVALGPAVTARAAPAAGAPVAIAASAPADPVSASPPSSPSPSASEAGRGVPPLPPVWSSPSQDGAARSHEPGAVPRPGPAQGDTAAGGDPQQRGIHVVQRGEHLWALAERAVLAARPAATGPQVAAYWRVLVEANRPRIRSGDPDLVFPGEWIVLPEQRPWPPA